MIKEIDERIAEIDKEIEEIMASDLVDEAKVYVLKRERHDLIHMCKNLNSHDKVYLARQRSVRKSQSMLMRSLMISLSKKGTRLVRRMQVSMEVLQPIMESL